MDRSIRIVRQLGQVCESYCVMFKEQKEKKTVPITVFLQRKENAKKILRPFLWRRSIICRFSRVGGGGVLEPNPSGKRGVTVI